MGRVLIACEESQTVCKAFRELGHEAYSCDIQECSGGHQEWHIQGDAIEALYSQKWDLVIAHPPCTRLANSGVRWLAEKELWKDLAEAMRFFERFIEYGRKGNKIAIENPIPHKYAVEGMDTPYYAKGIGKYTQVIQPWQFGHEQMKATCLWLYGLPDLVPNNIVGPPPKDKEARNKWQDCWLASPGPDRQKIRSKTYFGIAQAMAEQWGKLI